MGIIFKQPYITTITITPKKQKGSKELRLSFHGGYIFKNFEGSAEAVIHDMAVPERVLIQLSSGLLKSFKPLVGKGDVVRAGDTIIKSRSGTKTYLVSPVSGTVSKAGKDGITINSDGSSFFEPVEGHPREPWHLEQSEVLSIFCETGCSFLMNNRFTSLKKCDKIKYIIINAVHNSPLNQSWIPEIFGDSTVFSHGLRTLSALFPEAEIITAINKRNKRYFETSGIKELAKIRIMSDRYPQENPELLSRDTVNRRPISPEGEPDESIFVIPFSYVIQIAEVMTQGRPFIDRILLIAGPGVSNPGWYRVRIGTPFSEIKKRLFKSDDRGPWRVIRGNPLTGEGLDSLDVSVLPKDDEISVIHEHAVRELFRFLRPGFASDSYSKTTVAEFIPILPKKLDTSVHGGVRPCVQCNYCDEVCPVDIYPFLIWKHVGVDAVEESFRLRPYECIECGLCDYVCPSKIDISPSVKKAKEEYRKMRRADEVSD